jgi:TRAP-type mannitol/chloroaromatic compound transport system substrate-binding protein
MDSKSSRRRFLKYAPLGAGALVLTACAENNTPASNATTSAATSAATTAAGSAATTAAQAAPAQQGQTYTLKLQSTWPQKDFFHETFVAWGKKVEEMAGGRLKIDILPSGAVVGAFQLIDAVNSGTLDGGHGVPAYWFGKKKAASLFGTGPSYGMDSDMLLGWIHYGGGQDLYNELIQKDLKLNVVSFFHGPMPTQPLGWFKNEVKSADDFKGLKYRTVGIAIDVFTDMGASVVALPGGEIVSGLERSLIDGAEFNNPSSDKVLGFPDVRKTYMLQSYHQPLESFELIINKTKFDALPKDLQSIIKYAAMAQSADFAWTAMDRNSKDLAEMKEKNGVKTFITPKAVLEAQLRAWDKVIDKEAKADPFFAKVLESQRSWAQRVGAWKQEVFVDNVLAYNHFFKKTS